MPVGGMLLLWSACLTWGNRCGRQGSAGRIKNPRLGKICQDGGLPSMCHPAGSTGILNLPRFCSPPLIGRTVFHELRSRPAVGYRRSAARSVVARLYLLWIRLARSIVGIMIPTKTPIAKNNAIFQPQVNGAIAAIATLNPIMQVRTAASSPLYACLFL
jgi:hypothetical protein